MAGYDPRAALDLWELMSCVEQDAVTHGQSISIENRFALLRTHPTSEDRLSALQKDLGGAMRLWREHAPKRKEQVKREQAAVEGVVSKEVGENVNEDVGVTNVATEKVETVQEERI